MTLFGNRAAIKTLRSLSLVIALFSAACSQLNLAVVNIPTHFDDVAVLRDVSFGKEDWQKLDIYKPANAAANSKLPVIVFYYGGRWEEGSKNDYRFVGSALAQQNYVAVIADYRKYPSVKFPVFVEDAAQSLAWTYDHIATYGGDNKAIHLSGHSAGAHIASLLTVDPRYLKKEGKDRSAVIRDFVGLAGPYSFTPDEEDLKDMFGPPSNYPQMQATTFIDGKQPPMFLLWGQKDRSVGKFNMEKLAVAIHEKGGCVQTKTYPDLDHVWIVANLSWLGSRETTVLKDWTAFLNGGRCKSSSPG